jgi:hypothetical protein
LQFYGFHLMPWPYMSKEFVESGDSSWVTSLRVASLTGV